MYNDTLQQNRTESKNRTTTNEDENKSVCISCGEQRHERYKITLRQPLHGNGYGRLIETGSVCEQCAGMMRNNAIAEERQ